MSQSPRSGLPKELYFIPCVIVALLLGVSGAEEPAFTPPASERIAALLEFGGPVSLVRQIATAEDLQRQKKRRGTSIASFAYDDPEHTSETIVISVLLAGTFAGKDRAELIRWIGEHSSKDSSDLPATGSFKTSDGRSIYQFPMAMGPGGFSYGALLACRDPGYELVVVQQTDFHDDEDWKNYNHHVTPKKELRFVIEEIERLVFAK